MMQGVSRPGLPRMLVEDWGSRPQFRACRVARGSWQAKPLNGDGQREARLFASRDRGCNSLIANQTASLETQ